jgi:poly(3-hydroxybutyrate) depolymerase
MTAWLALFACSKSNSNFPGLSNGQCPDVTATVQSEFRSGGKKRRVQTVLPAQVPPSMGLMYSFHGLNPKSTDPITNLFEDHDLQAVADQYGVAIVAPEALPTTVGFLGDFLLWGILGEEEDDLTLFDDLHICMTNTWDIDLDAVALWGHSGGALWTTLLSQQRGETFSTAVEFSGGSDVSISIPGLAGPWVPYEETPAVPYLLSTAGAADVWPDETVSVLDFEAATDTLEGKLLDDGRTVVRCAHDLGHYVVPTDQWQFATEWMSVHRRGAPSPYEVGELALIPGCAASAP